MEIERPEDLRGFVVGGPDEYSYTQRRRRIEPTGESYYDQQMQQNINAILPEEDLTEDEFPSMEVLEEQQKLEDIFEPGDLEDRFLTKEDMEIVENDMPERLQLRRKDQPLPDNTEKILETFWIL